MENKQFNIIETIKDILRRLKLLETQKGITSLTLTSKFVPPVLTSDPVTPTEGEIYFNSVSNKHRGYDGTSWNNLY